MRNVLCLRERKKKETVRSQTAPVDDMRNFTLSSSLHQSVLLSLVFLCSLSLETSIFFRSYCKAEDVNALLVLELH